MEGVVGECPLDKGGLEQAEGEEAGDGVADDADLAQKEEAGLPRHVDEGPEMRRAQGVRTTE